MMNSSASLKLKAAAELERRRRAGTYAATDPLVTEDVADFIGQHMFIPETGRALELHPEQTAVLNAMNTRDSNGDFRYSTWIYSAPKKSAKTTIGAGVALWQAWRVPYGEVYIIGNDQKQADSRMAQAIRYCVEHNPAMAGRVKVATSKYTIKLDNGTRIEAIPVDPRGEAGMNPTGLFWTEAWGAVGKAAELLWTEAALSPTRAGQSFKFVDSYAGFTGESLLLERLHHGIVTNGEPHAALPEVYTRGGSIAYWCTRRFLPWQSNDAAAAYYAQEALEKTPSEFRRIHNNEWVTSENVFVPSEWWDACRGDVPTLDKRTPMVLAMDAGVTSDCFALVGVSRLGDTVAVRYAQAWKPNGGKLDFALPEAEVRRLCREYNILCVAYDPYQLHDMATRLGGEGVAWMYEFKQGEARLKADKLLYDMIRERRIVHNGDATLTEHVKNANAKTEGDNRLRIVKRAEHLKIDLAVALSMATERATALNLD